MGFLSDNQLNCYLIEPNTKINQFYLKVSWHPMSGYTTDKINNYLLCILTAPPNLKV
jgi:hypothetical protein